MICCTIHSNISESELKKSTVTTIRIHTDVRAKLEAIKMHRRETVEDVIVRLLNIYDELASVSKQCLGTTIDYFPQRQCSHPEHYIYKHFD